MTEERTVVQLRVTVAEVAPDKGLRCFWPTGTLTIYSDSTYEWTPVENFSLPVAESGVIHDGESSTDR